MRRQNTRHGNGSIAIGSIGIKPTIRERKKRCHNFQYHWQKNDGSDAERLYCLASLVMVGRRYWLLDEQIAKIPINRQSESQSHTTIHAGFLDFIIKETRQPVVKALEEIRENFFLETIKTTVEKIPSPANENISEQQSGEVQTLSKTNATSWDGQPYRSPNGEAVENKKLLIPPHTSIAPHRHEDLVIGRVLEGSITISKSATGVSKTFFEGDTIYEVMYDLHEGRTGVFHCLLEVLSIPFSNHSEAKASIPQCPCSRVDR